MNYRQQQKELVFARIAFYVCMVLALVVGYKGYSAAQSNGLINVSSMVGALPGGYGMQSQGYGQAIGPAVLKQTQLFVPIASGVQTPSGTTVSKDDLPPSDQSKLRNVMPVSEAIPSDSQSQDSNGDSSIVTGPSQTPSAPQMALIQYAIRTLPANVTMLKSLLRAETELTQGDPTQAGPVDQTLAHPMAQTSTPTQSDTSVDQIVAMVAKAAPSLVAQSGAQDSGGQDQSGQDSGPNQNPVAEMGMGLSNSPWTVAIICFALGFAAQKMFKRQDPAVIYRPNVGLRPPSIFTPNWQNATHRSRPDLTHTGSFCQYQPYFIGQELEVQPGAPRTISASYGVIAQRSRMFAKSTHKMVRRFLEF